MKFHLIDDRTYPGNFEDTLCLQHIEIRQPLGPQISHLATDPKRPKPFTSTPPFFLQEAGYTYIQSRGIETTKKKNAYTHQ